MLGGAQIVSAQDEAVVPGLCLPLDRAREQPGVGADPIEIRIERADERVGRGLEAVGVAAKTQFNFASGSGTAFASTSRAMIGIMRLLCETACASSFPQISEVTESGESTKTKVSAPSIAGKIACMNSSAGRMPCQSTQVSRPRLSSASSSRRTNSLSFRE